MPKYTWNINKNEIPRGTSMKQFMLICNQDMLPHLQALFGLSIQFLEIQGMNVPNQNVNVIVIPTIPPVNPMPSQPNVTTAETPPTETTPQPE